MKKIILLVFIFATCFVQAQEPEPDSLVGIYVGEAYYRETESDPWTIVVDTQYVTFVDTVNCTVNTHGFFTNYTGYRDFYTEYSYCFGTPPWNPPCPLFYSSDSVRFIWDNIPWPPPSTDTFSKRFFGKRVPNSSYVGLNEVKPDNVRLNLYPNPSCDILFFDFPGSDMINCNVTIRNVFGSIVYCDEVSGENCFIDVSGFADGIYFFEWSNVLGNGIDKFIVY